MTYRLTTQRSTDTDSEAAQDYPKNKQQNRWTLVVASALAVGVLAVPSALTPSGQSRNTASDAAVQVDQGSATVTSSVPGRVAAKTRHTTKKPAKARPDTPAVARAKPQPAKAPAAAPAPAPATVARQTSAATGSCVSQPMGIPASGAYFGAAVTGNQSLATVEQKAGRLGIHRMYFSAGQVNSAIQAVKADLAAGRLPWISFKPPYSWADMANGRGDAWARDLSQKLATVGGPVWLAIFHEPEHQGDEQAWKRMQQHLAPIVHSLTNNVAYTVIYTGWDIFFTSQFALNGVWPGSQYIDILGFDMYNDYASGRLGSKPMPMLDPMKYYNVAAPWARAHNVKWAIGETALTRAAAQKDPGWLATAFSEMKNTGGIGMSYFDSSLNSITDWTLDDAIRMDAFRSQVQLTARICSIY